jgi:heme exporter protein B
LLAGLLAALLATLLGLDRLFQADQEDGSLDVLRMADAPLELVVVSKCVAHWLTTCLPLVLAAPLFGLMLALEWDALIALAATLVVGTPALTFLGSIGAALTASLRRGGLLMAILILPLTIPVLIFGVSAASSVTVATSPFWPPFFILGALSLASLALAPFAAAGALRALSE